MKTQVRRDNSGVAPQDVRQRQARVWLRTLTSGDVKPWDAEAFRRWLSASPGNKEAFHEVRQRWAALKPGVGALLRTDPQAAGFHARTLSGSPFGRRAFLGAAVGAAAVAGMAVWHPPARLWPAPGEWGADLRTATGEQQALTLGDGVHITLNTQTSIRQRVASEGAVGMDLLAGEAAVDMPARRAPFSVMAGEGRTLAEVGHFEVRYLAGKVRVTCVEGSVRVVHPAGQRMLQAAQQLVYDAVSVSGVAGVNTADASAWRKGELVFSNTRLSDVLDEINRYRAGRVVLLNDNVRNSPVSGRFVIKALDSALSQLQHSFDLHARALPGGLLLLS
ncbi:FecR family protein [Variovorax sp. 54]|uniref:FecR family protein n=1 Tax=Variovorax sp. 54 TaxID=2035212 RepID=UPI000C5EED15|nr:FecR domain-containing protein [Variovorax sp. 54]PIF73567.1 FecR family protein [Variovorax sp. 54]